MAPTTLVGQKTKTTPRGRDPQGEGHPIKVCELLSQFERVRFLVRTTVTSPARVRETKRMLRKALQYQIDGVGFSMVEVLSPCPTYWRMAPVEACRHVEEAMVREFPPGVIKDVAAPRR
jgi:2-oxoglutarate ferredoxin oxidoreductase subunit beta